MGGASFICAQGRGPGEGSPGRGLFLQGRPRAPRPLGPGARARPPLREGAPARARPRARPSRPLSGIYGGDAVSFSRFFFS